ncbi:unnamed protein product, partial [Mycena citricolor]
NALLCYTCVRTLAIPVMHTKMKLDRSGTTGRPKGVITTLRGSYLAAIGNAYESRLDGESTYLWILPMFHAAGWTFPWANVFAFAKQIMLRVVDNKLIWKHLNNSGVTHYCGAPTV